MRRFWLVFLTMVPCLVMGQEFGGLVNEPDTRGGTWSRGTITMTRPSNATQYAANELVANSATEASVNVWKIRTARKSGIITNMTLWTDTANATNAWFRLWILTDSANWQKAADNAAFVLSGLDSDYVGIVGYVDFILSTEGTGGTAAFAQTDGIALPFVTLTDRELYGLLEVKAAYLPKSGGRFRLKYTIYQ